MMPSFSNHNTAMLWSRACGSGGLVFALAYMKYCPLQHLVVMARGLTILSFKRYLTRGEKVQSHISQSSPWLTTNVKLMMPSLPHHNIAIQSRENLGQDYVRCITIYQRHIVFSLVSILWSRAHGLNESVSAPAYVRYYSLRPLAAIVWHFMALPFNKHLIEEKRIHSI